MSCNSSEPPSIVTKPEPLEVLPGMNVSFRSVIRGTPPFKIHWFKGSSELTSGTACLIQLKDSAAILELYEVNTTHIGDYTCVVSNEAGKDSCTTQLFVKGNPFFSAVLSPALQLNFLEPLLKLFCILNQNLPPL